jgi:hypothetical protein
MMLSDDPKKERRCYGCGQFGHMRGTEECKAGEDAVWGGAPKAYEFPCIYKYSSNRNKDYRGISL